MNKGKSNNKNVLSISYFYDLFAKRKYLFPTSYFLFPINTRKKKIPISHFLYKKIVQKYLDIYFNEFYFDDIPKYFMLSGLLQKAKSISKIMSLQNGNFQQSKGISWIWYQRPSIAYYSNIRLIKLKGSTNKLNKLDAQYKIDNDIDTLVSVKTVLDKIRQQHKFFKR